MFISFRETMNTGGHVMVDELIIQNVRELKMIGVSMDCIVGYSTHSILEADMQHELFVCYTKESLEKHVPSTLANTIWDLFTGCRGRQ